jgi:hypothetical protein
MQGLRSTITTTSVAAALAATIAAPSARADAPREKRREVAGLSPDDKALAPAAPEPATEADKASSPLGGPKSGNMLANMKIGPSFGLGAMPTQFALELDAGYAVTKDGNGYVVVSPQFQFGDVTMVVIPAGFQYDIPIVRDRGIYAYPRASMGYARVTNTGGGDAFALMPEAGVKWNATAHIHVGFEPLSLPVFFGKGDPQVLYRMFAYAGGDF